MPDLYLFFRSPSAFLTPSEGIPARPTFVAETTQGSHSTTSSMNPKLAVLFYYGGTPIGGYRRCGSDISSSLDTEIRAEADLFIEHLTQQFKLSKLIQIDSVPFFYRWLIWNNLLNF